MGDLDEPEPGQDEETAWPIRSDDAAIQVALEESRRRYRNEVEIINDADDRAMRGARTGLIIIGILVSATAFVEPDTLGDLSVEVTVMGALGLSLVFGSMLFALGTYTATVYPTGVGEEHREAALQDGYSEREWTAFLIEEYGKWIDEAAEMADANARYLFNTVVMQAIGVALLATAFTVAYLNRIEDIPPQTSMRVILGFLLLGFLLNGIVFLVRDAADRL